MGDLHRSSFRPSGPSSARLLILHGYGDHSGRFAHFSRWLAERGVASDTFDFRGHGRSPGKRGFVRRWDEYLDDLTTMLAALRPVWAADGIDGSPLYVLGHSHGGLVAAAAGIGGILREADVAGVLLSAPYLLAAHPLSWPWRVFASVTNVLLPSIQVKNGLSADQMSADAAMVAESRGDTLLLRAATPRWYASTVRTQARVVAKAADFRLPLLCLMGDRDSIADLRTAQAFVDRAGSARKALEIIPGARHEILRETSRESTFERIRAWMMAPQ